MKTKFKIIQDAKRQARLCFVGIAIPHQPRLAEGTYGPIRSEKILKFNRSALKSIGKSKVEKVNSRYNGGDDLMILPVGYGLYTLSNFFYVRDVLVPIWIIFQ